MKCPKCGREAGNADRFCRKCGAPITFSEAKPENVKVKKEKAVKEKKKMSAGGIVAIVAAVLVLLGGGFWAAIHFGLFGDRDVKTDLSPYMEVIDRIIADADSSHKNAGLLIDVDGDSTEELVVRHSKGNKVVCSAYTIHKGKLVVLAEDDIMYDDSEDGESSIGAAEQDGNAVILKHIKTEDENGSVTEKYITIDPETGEIISDIEKIEDEGDTEYYINGEKVSEKEYDDAVEKTKPGSMTGDEELTDADYSDEKSLDELRKDIEEHSENTEPAKTEEEPKSEAYEVVRTQFFNNSETYSETGLWFDENGNMIKNVLTWGDAIITHEYKYDEDGNLIEEKRDDMGGFYRITTYEYDFDGNGNLTEKRVYENTDNYYSDSNSNAESYCVYTYEYDNDGRLIKEICDNPESEWNASVIIYTYDSQGRLSAEEHVNIGYTVSYKYDGDLLVEMTSSSDESTYTTVYTYDDKGNLIKEEYVDAFGDRHFTIYEYDKDGNVIAKEWNEFGEYGNVRYEYSIGIPFEAVKWD